MTISKPTPGELEILDVLWTSGPASVREIHQTLCKNRPVTYTTTLKLLQIMNEKGLVKRDEKAKAHIYRPTRSQRDTQKRLVGELLDKAFHGSAMKLVQHVLETKPATREELDEIRRLINAADKGGAK